MPKIKTSELIDAALDWAVAACEAHQRDGGSFPTELIGWFKFSTDWAHGGPIIEREGILLRPIRRQGHSMDGLWIAMFDGTNTGSMVQWVKRAGWPRSYLAGPTPLIAAMRCYCCSKLGDVVDIPEELCQQQKS